MATNPSYLFKRGSIYYFQVRIPDGFACANNYNPQKVIRRSTRTGNRREALRIAREWWVQLMADDFQYEKQIDKERDMYNRGMELAKELGKIDQNNPFDWNNFTEELSEYDAKCLALYEENQKSTPAPIPVPEPSTTLQTPAHLLTGVQPSTDRLSDVVGKYVEKKMNQKKPWAVKTKDKMVSQLTGNPPINNGTQK
ncbi:MAG: hypothetical protein KME58_18715 [Candidatus Thiodiazotropha sp. (ex Lucina pensylvanica)]|nr:hypothetical protein [Candidatus Thiodiazotropha sp. (ex Lucina pensylvanica)]